MTNPYTLRLALTALPIRAACLAAGLCVLASSALAFDLPPNDGYATDSAGILRPEEESNLEQILTQYQRQTTNEIAIVTVPTIGDESIADVAVDIMRTWGIGAKGRDNGVLILVAYDDRKLFIATGYGLEGAVPDIVAKGIIEREIQPLFRTGAYGQGLFAGVQALQKHIGGEYTADRYKQPAESPGFAWFFFFAFIIFNWLAAFFARSKSWWAGGIAGGVLGVLYTTFFSWWLSIPILVGVGLLFDFLVSQAGRQGRRGRFFGGGFGGWGGGTGGGGFRGFGGGSGGGGGAGGSW